MRNVHRVHVTDIWSWYRVELRVGDHLGRSEELVSRCVECDLAEPESLASLGGSAPGVVDGILSFVKEYQEDGKIIIKFVKSEENEADIFTKNTTNVIFSYHQKKLVWYKANVEEEMNQELNQSKNQQEGC